MSPRLGELDKAVASGGHQSKELSALSGLWEGAADSQQSLGF